MGRTTPTPRRRIPRALTPMPLPTTDAYEEVLSLDFVCRRKSRSILDCTVVSPDACTPYFHIMTSSDVNPAQTFFRTNKGRTVAAVEWGSKGRGACVEVYKSVTRQPVSEWLGISGDARQANISCEPGSKSNHRLAHQLSHDVRIRPELCLGPAEQLDMRKSPYSVHVRAVSLVSADVPLEPGHPRRHPSSACPNRERGPESEARDHARGG